MPFAANLLSQSHVAQPVLPVTIALTDRVSVLSIMRGAELWFRASFLCAFIVHGLVLAVLLPIGMPRPASPAAGATVQLIEVASVAQAQPDPEPPAQPATADAAGPKEPETPPEPPPMPAVLDPVARVAENPRPEEHAPPEVGLAIGTPPSRLRPTRPNAAKTVAAKPTAVIAPQAASGNAREDRPSKETLAGRIRNAVQAAVQCPSVARMMGQSGKAAVAFDYRDGAVVGGLQLARSSGTPVLDNAAMTAVRNAHYPEAPPEESRQVYHLLIWVEEACSD